MDVREECGSDSMRKRSGYENNNHFYRLPEELIVYIFNKIVDLKCLCYCSLVSKHFTLLVTRVQTVSVTVTGMGSYGEESEKKITQFALKLPLCRVEELPALLDSSLLQNMRFPVFLDKLTELKCIYLDYDYTGTSADGKSGMQKIKFCRDGAMFESFVALDYLYVHKETENEAMEENIDNITAVLMRVRESWWQFRVRYMEWICFVVLLLKCHPSLRRVTIADSEVHGKLVIGDEEGVRLHIGVPTRLLTLFTGCILKYGWVPALRLPMSGYVMRWVALAIVYLPDNSGARAKKLDEIEFLDFDDELRVREGVKEFLKNHKDVLRILEQ